MGRKTERDDRMFAPVAARGVYLRQAAFIALGIIVAFGCLVYYVEHEGSLLLLLAAEAVLVMACGSAMMSTLNVIGAFIGSMEGIMVVLGFVLLLFFLPALAVVFFVVALIQAARAEPTTPPPGQSG